MDAAKRKFWEKFLVCFYDVLPTELFQELMNQSAEVIRHSSMFGGLGLLHVMVPQSSQMYKVEFLASLAAELLVRPHEPTKVLLSNLLVDSIGPFLKYIGEIVQRLSGKKANPTLLFLVCKSIKFNFLLKPIQSFTIFPELLPVIRNELEVRNSVLSSEYFSLFPRTVLCFTFCSSAFVVFLHLIL